MKLAVCGCSWSSRDPNYPDTEFGYFISNDLDWDYKNYGRVGCDNFSIRLQVDQAIKDKADFVIINWTTACRFSWNHSGKAYDPKQGISHLDYDVDEYMTNETSHPTYPANEPVIISQSLTGMINTQDIDISYEELIKWWPNLVTSMTKKQYEVFREYFSHMYDDDLEAHKQYYIMQSAVKALQDAHIPFIFAPNTFGFQQTMMEYKGLSDVFSSALNLPGHKNVSNIKWKPDNIKNLQLHAYCITLPSGETIEAPITDEFKRNLDFLGLDLPSNINHIFQI